MIVFYLNLKPNMVVCESGTGSGALSHCILRTIAPKGKLFTYEFNGHRAHTATKEFAKNRVGHLVTVTHKDVCGKHGPGGFDRPQASVDAIILDLPEPWTAIPHCAHGLKPNGRIASYSPCVEQSQQTIELMKKYGFHSIKTMEFRLKEHYVDEAEYELPPREKRPRVPSYSHPNGPHKVGISFAGEDIGAKADKEKSEYETEGKSTVTNTATSTQPNVKKEETTPTSAANGTVHNKKRRKVLVTRPFVMMRGHTAFLTFATAGNKAQPDPNTEEESST
jgi:tRNA (adenine57-N1/adenine58-N1)-methyltransferase